MWVLKNIDPTHFNVASDLVAQVFTGVLVLALSMAYPYLVWESVKRGKGVSLNGVLQPPQSMLDAFRRFRNGGGARWLVVALVLIMAVVTFTHAMADLFLEFVTVNEGLEEAYFLGSETAGTLPTYELIGDKSGMAFSEPFAPPKRLLRRAGDIALGLSRHSIFPPGVVQTTEKIILSGKMVYGQSTLVDYSTGEPARPVPFNPQVNCSSPLSTKDNVLESVTTPDKIDYYKISPHNLSVPDCDYESIVPFATIEKDPGDKNWQVLDWTWYFENYHLTVNQPLDWGVFSTRRPTTEGSYLPMHVALSLNETDLAAAREDWALGRRIEDGLSVFMGEVVTVTQDPLSVVPVPDDLEIKMDFSVLSGLFQFDGYLNLTVYLYTLSSWSHTCPVVDSKGDLSILNTRSGNSSASGCLVDLRLWCDTVIWQDTHYNETPPPEDGHSWCMIYDLAVTTLSGIEVDPFMLAAYQGIAVLNGGLNVDNIFATHNIGLNSIAAAYIMTREIVQGTLVVEEVRPSISPGYAIFMILPLAVALPLLVLKYCRKGSPPVPQNVWEVMVLGRGEDEQVPLRSSSTAPYPPCPTSVAKFGITHDNSTTFDHLGIGAEFVPMDHPLVEESERPEQPVNAAGLSTESAQCEAVVVGKEAQLDCEERIEI